MVTLGDTQVAQGPGHVGIDIHQALDVAIVAVAEFSSIALNRENEM
jgi:hypothetical protein